jgi:hypothetical protein
VIQEIKQRVKDSEESEDNLDILILDCMQIKHFSKTIALALRIRLEIFYFLEKLKNLQCLSLNECEVESLENFPKLSNLKRVNITK